MTLAGAACGTAMRNRLCVCVYNFSGLGFLAQGVGAGHVTFILWDGAFRERSDGLAMVSFEDKS